MAEQKVIKYFKGTVRSVDADKKTATIVISDESKDRYDERVLTSSFKKTKKEFMKHPVLLSSHAYRGLQNQIGQFLKLKADEEAKQTIGEIEYFTGLGNPEADWAWVLAEKGVAAFSIGFIAKQYKDYNEEERQKNGGVYRDFEDIELLEVSQVLVPANPSALQKSFGDESEDLFLKELSDQIVEVLKDAEDGITWEEKKEETDEGAVPLTGEKILEVLNDLIDKRLSSMSEEMRELRGSWDELKTMIAELKTAMEEVKTLAETKEVSELGNEKDEETGEVKTKKEEKDGDSNEPPEGLEEVIGPEKIAELKSALFGYNLSDNDALKKLFDDMTSEVKEKLSVQS